MGSRTFHSNRKEARFIQMGKCGLESSCKFFSSCLFFFSSSEIASKLSGEQETGR